MRACNLFVTSVIVIALRYLPAHATWLATQRPVNQIEELTEETAKQYIAQTYNSQSILQIQPYSALLISFILI